MGFLYYISYGTLLAAFAFVTLSLASGLLYVSELVEEHSRLAKTYGQRGVYFIILLHVILYFTESLPFPQTAFSIMCHIVYLQNFSPTWPLISLSSPSFLASCVLVILDHFIWFFHFSRITQEARRTQYHHTPPNTPAFIEIASFFGLCVWLAPIFLFLSLSANDNALPVSADPSSSSMQTAQRVSLFRSIFSFESLLRPRQSRTDSTEGLLAPQTPDSRRMSFPLPSPSILPPGASPRYPDFESNLSGQSFTLTSPPKRLGPMLRKGDTVVRRTSSRGSSVDRDR